MILLDNENIKPCEFGLATAVNENGNYKVRIFKTLDNYIYIFPFGRQSKPTNLLNIAELRKIKRDCETPKYWDINYANKD